MQTAAITTSPHEREQAFGRDRKRRAFCGICLGLVITFLFVLAGNVRVCGQMPGPSPQPTPGQTSGRGGGFGRPSEAPPFSNDEDSDPAMAERRMRALNAERQKQMMNDANKLLKLAKELNDEVAATNESAFTPDQLHKIAEIEKLAKNVRERMTAGVGQPQGTMSAPALVYPVH